jgi:hypothetical protein
MTRTYPFSAILAAVLCVTLAASLSAQAQTGQGLIANPLLSQDKIKEVRRQIIESAHKELVPPPPPPASVPPTAMPMQARPAGSGMPMGMPMAMPSGGPSGAMPQGMQAGTYPAMGSTMIPGQASMPVMMPPTVNSDAARQQLSRLQVVTIVGETAILAAPSAGVSRPPMMGAVSMPGAPAGMQGAQMPMQMAAASGQSSEELVRRNTAFTLRHGQKTLIDGIDVTAHIQGDVVQLTMTAMPSAMVYQGSMQPAAYSPSTVVAMSARERASTEYANRSKPEATSMGASPGFPQAGQQVPSFGQSMPVSGQVPRPSGF